MAKARALDRRRRSVRNIRKITRTMELIATARFKKAMDRSVAARDYTTRLTKVLENIAGDGAGIVHPLLDVRPTKKAAVLILSGNRGLCGGSASASRNSTIDPLRSGLRTAITSPSRKGSDSFSSAEKKLTRAPS